MLYSVRSEIQKSLKKKQTKTGVYAWNNFPLFHVESIMDNENDIFFSHVIDLEIINSGFNCTLLVAGIHLNYLM